MEQVTATINNIRSRLGYIGGSLDDLINLAITEYEECDILLKKYNIMVDKLREQSIEVYECRKSKCDYISFDQTESSECSDCKQRFCTIHFKYHECLHLNHGCSEV